MKLKWGEPLVLISPEHKKHVERQLARKAGLRALGLEDRCYYCGDPQSIEEYNTAQWLCGHCGSWQNWNESSEEDNED